MDTETIRVPKWFLQVFAVLTTSIVLGGFSWCIWVSVTLDRWTHIMEDIPHRIALMETVQQSHAIEIRRLRRVKLDKPEMER